MTGKAIRIALADDQPLVAEGLGYVLERGGFDVVGIRHSGKGALDLVREEDPDILVVDLFMPDMDGLKVAEVLTQEGSRTNIVILTASKRAQDAARAMNLGVSGYLVKDTDSARLSHILTLVGQGKDGLSSETLDAILSWQEGSNILARTSLPEPLTDQQARVLTLISAGLTNAEIADVLSLSENTVKTHVRHIFRKLNVSDRANAVIWAYENGLVPLMRTDPA